MRYIISSALASLLAGATLAQAEAPRVVTDIPPVHALVAQVMGELGTPVLLLAAGASEHDFQLRPSQAADLADADLVVWIGPELTPWLDRALTGLSDGSTKLALLQAEGTLRQDFAADGAHMGHDDHADHDDHGHDDHGPDDGGPDDGGHAHAGTDPHAWLDPDNARHWLGLIAAELSRLDPANAATYAANAAAAETRIAALDAEVAAQLAPVRDRPVVVFHDAYGYFAAHYGLSVFGSVALGDATAPGAARLAALREALAGGGATCLFPEAQHDAGMIEDLAADTGLRIGAALDPNGSTLEPGPQAYEALLGGLAAALVACLAPA
ncbi:MAG: hypothetical protein RIT14_697 [Pseudomonadota bacterium]|jgi:zinc transport system substrate-binding protein